MLGSGNVVHNLGLMARREGTAAFDWAARFSRFVRNNVLSGDHAALIDFAGHEEDARLAIPTPEHYLPLLYVLGTQRASDAPDIFVEGSEFGSLDMMSLAL